MGLSASGILEVAKSCASSDQNRLVSNARIDGVFYAKFVKLRDWGVCVFE